MSNFRHPYSNHILLHYQISMLLCAILETSFLFCSDLHLWPNPAKPLWEAPLPPAQPARERNAEGTAKEAAGMSNQDLLVPVIDSLNSQPKHPQILAGNS